MKVSLARSQFVNRLVDSTVADIIDGLMADQKVIASKYFYDEKGSELFEMICELPEYYQTRTELGLLSKHVDEIVQGFRNGNLIELGSGSNRKVRILLEALGSNPLQEICYMPVDVCHEALIKSSRELLRLFPGIFVQPVIADFTKDFKCLNSHGKKLIMFFGSTIGNLDESQASVLLGNVSSSMNPGDHFLVGLDMVKPAEILEAAYNDSRGITRQFNKNILRVINRETGSDFKPDLFEHIAYFNERCDRIEMHLRALKDHVVRIPQSESSFFIRRGETIRTEICRKFAKDTAEQMFEQAGMRINRWYTDSRGWFSLVEVALTR